MDWTEGSCFLNGRWQTLGTAQVSVLDRGFIFGDGVYEVIPVDTLDGVRAPFRATEHFERLGRSLAAIGMGNPYGVEAWLALLAELIERHPWPRQSVYVQVTRGVSKRDHAFPADTPPTVFAAAWPWPEIPSEQIERGIAVATHADERWLRCDIKSTSLLGNVLMKQYAIERGASEVILFRDGRLTEGSSTNVLIVQGDTIVAPVKDHAILPGITYDAVFDIARARGATTEARMIRAEEVRSADEVWISSSGREVLAVTQIDGVPLGNGAPGHMYRKVLAWYQDAKRDEARRWQAQRPNLKRAA
jgi:D-alanine transaminase